MLTSNPNVAAQYRMQRLEDIENDLLQAFLEHIPDDVYFKDRDSRFLRISRSLATRFGLSDASSAIGKTDADMFSSEHAKQAFADEQEIISTGRAMVGKEEKETWPDGRQTWAFTTKVPLRDKTGRIIGTMGISRDITERKKAEQDLNEYKARLEELVQSRTAQLSRANAQLECDIAKRNLTEQELARNAHELARSNADLEQFAYVASHDLQEPLRMVASSTQLSQLFQNLIGNAVKYCNGHKPQIEISSCAESEHWVFSVDDNGIGIEPQYFERIFQMFQRLHTRQHYSGTGVGLAICRKIVERHGGKIWLESQIGSGSKFIFTIPKGQSE